MQLKIQLKINRSHKFREKSRAVRRNYRRRCAYHHILKQRH